MSSSDKSKNKDEKARSRIPKHPNLTKTEKKILLKAIKLYRSKIPSYIESNQVEIRRLETIVKKLS